MSLRLYDLSLIEALEKDFQQHGAQYRNRNEYLQHCIRQGLEREELRDEPSRQDRNGELMKLLDEIMKYLAAEFQAVHLDIEVLKKLLSSIYYMSKFLSEGLPVLSEQVEDGLFDELPERFDAVYQNKSEE